MKQLSSLIIILTFCYSAIAQQFVVSGRVIDAQTGEILSDANIWDKTDGAGVVSNAYGLYTIRVNAGVCILQCSMLGYTTQIDTLNVDRNSVVNFMLHPSDYQLGQVEVTGSKMHSGQFRLNQKDIQALPVVGGEPDLLKALQYLPGVSAGNMGTNNISIRGSDQWGNLVLLDEAVVYNPNHALSFFSVFNNDAIQKVNLYKSYFPLTYGGRASAVIDVRMREGNTQKREVQATVGIIASKLMLERPFKNRKGSYLISGRVAYPGVWVNLWKSNRSRLKGTEMTFYDVNAKINRNLGDRDRIYFSVYNGGDHTVFERLIKGYGMNWGNTTATFRWNHILNEKIYTNCSAIFSNYYYRYESLRDGLRYLWKSDMQSYQLKYDMEYSHSNALKLKTGVALQRVSTMPGSVKKFEDDNKSNIVPYRMESRKMLDMALYGEMEWNFADRFQLNAGVRLSALNTSKTSSFSSQTYLLVEPRAELSYQLEKTGRLVLSYNQASQNMHMLSNSSVGLPSDIWLPANALLKPAVMRQIALGYEKSLGNGVYGLSVEGYYRRTNGVIDYVDDANLFLNNRLESQILTGGKSKGYGIETSLVKNTGRLSGRASYTFSRAFNRIAGVEEGRDYPSILDRPHNFRLFLNYAISRRWEVASTFSYGSGMNLTMPIAQYQYECHLYYIYSSRNGYRAPAYHQWDVSSTWHLRRGSIAFSIINLYNRKNVFTIYASRAGRNTDAQVYKMYLYGVLPSVSYTIKF